MPGHKGRTAGVTRQTERRGAARLDSGDRRIARFGPGRLGSLPTRGSHRPVRAHIRAYGSSADRFAIPEGSPRLSVRVPWTCGRTSMGSACCPRSDLPADASLPSTGSSGASSPASTVLSRRYDLLPPVPPHFVAFAWRYLRAHSFASLPGGRVHRRGPELLTRSPGRELAEEATGSPKFPVIMPPLSQSIPVFQPGSHERIFIRSCFGSPPMTTQDDDRDSAPDETGVGGCSRR